MSKFSKLERRRKKGRVTPRKSRPEEEDENDEDDTVDIGAELNLGEMDINPEAQEILDTFANKLLEQVDKLAERNVIQIEPKQPITERKLFGQASKKKEDENCICCKVEGIVNSRKPYERQRLSSQMFEAVLTESTKDYVEDKKPEQEVTPEKSPVKSDSPPAPVFKTPKKNDDFIFKTPIKTVGGALTTPVKTPGSSGGIAPVIRGITPVSADQPASLTTPQKSLLLSPTTPVSRHIPASPVLFSPVSRISMTPTSSRTRHQSSLHTPINTPTSHLEDETFNSPTTPNTKQSPALSYYTPSPSPRSDYSVPSPSHTPGLKFLQQEGDRLSQSEDSCSSTPSPAKNKITGAQKRKTFRNLFKKATTEAAGKELGLDLEQKILKYPFDDKTGEKPSKSPDLEPYMSPAGGVSYSDYTSSPQISMRPSPDPAPGHPRLQDTASLSRHSSFVSPNRTCYLSPTGVALTSSVLGFHQSPVNTTDSENNDEDLNLVLSDDDEDDHKNKIVQSVTAETVTLEAAADTAMTGSEESIEAIKVNEIIHHLLIVIHVYNIARLTCPQQCPVLVFIICQMRATHSV